MRRESVYFCFASQNVHGPAAAPPLSATALIQRVHGICLVIYYPDLTRSVSTLESRTAKLEEEEEEEAAKC